MGELGFCNARDILDSIHTLFIRDATTDTGIPLFLVRFLHNKIFYGLFSSLRCYFLYLDTVKITEYTSILLLPYIMFAFIDRQWRKIILLTVFLMPIIFIINPFEFDIGAKMLAYQSYFITIAIIGGFKMVLRFQR